MSCGHIAAAAAGIETETAFTIDASRVTFGRRCLREVGKRARALGMTRVALFTDVRLRALPWFAEVEASLKKSQLEVLVFDAISIEPTDASFAAAAQFALDARPDGYVSLGGGSVIDTCKAANLLATYPAPLRTYVNAPVGDARPIPGPLKPHIACPTTSGTGSEVTGIAIFDDLALEAKTGIASLRLRPSEALVDPQTTQTLPSQVVAASGMDVLCHALESYTARPFTLRNAPANPGARPMSQGNNPWSDLGSREAIKLAGKYLARAVKDASDSEAREQIMWAATLAGIAFGNAGVHAPHAMAYAVAGIVRDFKPTQYPSGPIVPHGMAVSVNAPAVFRAFGKFCPERHLECAELLGVDTRGASLNDAGELLANATISILREIGIPNGLRGVGYGEADVPALVKGTLPQQRLLGNAPCVVDESSLGELFNAALSYW
jgi:hydroxyacid-oxoacid transhydrogenase